MQLDLAIAYCELVVDGVVVRDSQMKFQEERATINGFIVSDGDGGFTFHASEKM